MSDTANVARKMEQLGEGMKIHISETSKFLLDKVGGFRCDYRGTLDIGVSLYLVPFDFVLLFNYRPGVRWTPSG